MLSSRVKQNIFSDMRLWSLLWRIPIVKCIIIGIVTVGIYVIKVMENGENGV